MLVNHANTQSIGIQRTGNFFILASDPDDAFFRLVQAE